MFFVSFIICIILCVNTVQPINADAAAVSNIKNHSTETVYSDAGVIKVEKPPSKSSNNGSVVGVAKPLETAPVNENGIEMRHRGIKKTDNPPSINEPESNNTKNSTIASKQNLAIDDKEHTIANATTSHSQNSSQSTSKIEEKPASSRTIPNTQTNIDQSKINSSPANSSKTTATSSTSTTTTTTEKPTTTTTKKPAAPPKKPLVTIAVDDVPGLLQAAEAQSHSQPAKEPPAEEIRDNEPLSLQSSETISYTKDQKSSHNYIMSIIGVIVVIPLLVLITNCAVRRVRDYWSKRRYRRMDYLIEDMYN